MTCEELLASIPPGHLYEASSVDYVDFAAEEIQTFRLFVEHGEQRCELVNRRALEYAQSVSVGV